MDRLEDFDLLVPHGIGVEVGRRLHGRDAEQLQQMILEDVAQSAGGLVVLAAPFDPDIFRHRDLDVVDVAPVPDRLEDAVGEAEDQDILDGLLAQVVIDPVHLGLGKNRVDRLVQRLGALEVVAEGLLDDHPLPSLAGASDARRTEALHDHREELRRRSEVEDPVAVRAPLPIHPLQLRGEPAIAVLVVEGHSYIRDAIGHALPDGVIDRLGAREFAHRLRHVRLEVRLGQGRVGHPDHAEPGRQVPVQRQVVERRHQLAGGQVAGGAEDHHHRRVGRARQDQSLSKDILGQGGGGSGGHRATRI